MEMEAVADIFDQDNDGFINYREFIAALHPNRSSTEVHAHSNTADNNLYIETTVELNLPSRMHILDLYLGNAHASKINRSAWLPDCTVFDLIFPPVIIIT